MTTDLLPKRQRALCRECETDTFGPPEKYTFQNWPASTCPRSRKYHRKQAAMRQSGTTTYRDGNAVRDAPAGERRREAVNVTLDRDVPGGGAKVARVLGSSPPDDLPAAERGSEAA